MNEQTFFNAIRASLFNGKLTQGQVEGINALLREMKTWSDLRWKANVLAQVYHETGARMEPVREGFASTDAGAIKAVTRLYEQGKIRHNYAEPHARTGKSYFGRGHIQLTWYDNYDRMGDALNLPLAEQPELALVLDVSAAIACVGMLEGLFAKDGEGKAHNLPRYFNPTRDDPVGARRIVNGTDKAELIATYHRKFLEALKAANENGDQEELIAALEAGFEQLDVIQRQVEQLRDLMLRLSSALGSRAKPSSDARPSA